MDIDVKVWLFDILNAINEIESFLSDRPKLFEEFKKDLRTKRAIERNIEIIGEAINRILKKDLSIHITNARKIVGIRNRIIHSYDAISDDIIWGIILNHIPLLKIEIQNLISKSVD